MGYIIWDERINVKKYFLLGETKKGAEAPFYE